MSFYNNAIFWVDIDKIRPNPFQPRREFDEHKMRELANSIRQYGVLQPLTVTRKEVEKEGGGIATEYELIAGERRLRASTLAGLAQVPVLIRGEHDDDKIKLELAIIENLQREDLNAVDRARAFSRLMSEFGLKHQQIADRVGKSREYVANTIRILKLPQEMQDALSEGKISEGHTRPLLMLIDRPEEQRTLFREIMLKKLTVRDTEAIGRRIAFDRVRKKEYLYSPEILEMERQLSEALGTRVAIETKDNGGKLVIDFFGEEDLLVIFSSLASRLASEKNVPKTPEETQQSPSTPFDSAQGKELGAMGASDAPIDDRSKEEKEKDENAFDPSSFSI